MNSIDQELILAAKANNLPEVLRLLSVGADVNTTDHVGSTPLHQASSRSHVQVFKELEERGADIEAKDNLGRTALHRACANGHVTVVKELLSRGADTDARNRNSSTPLHLASLHDHQAIVKALLSRGADTDARNRNSSTPLHLASLHDHQAIVKALLSSGADILAASNDGRLPVHYEGHSQVSKYLLQQLYATTRRLPLHALLEDLTWIGNPNSSLSTVPPLRAALDRNVLGTNDAVEIIEYLVGQNPALPSSRDQDGSLPLHVACRRGAPFFIVQTLVNLYKASVKSMTPQGDLPLFLACDIPEPSLETIFILIKLYPDLVYREA
jgi:ankyrin repeat protein